MRTSKVSVAYIFASWSYEIKLSKGYVKKFNLALKRDRNTQRWYVDGGI
jgi:hypothetical protein